MTSENQFFYANSVEMGVTAYDVSLKFIRQGTPEGAKPGTAIVPAKLAELTVAMSPAHAKAMLVGMYKAVIDYEKNIGHITLEAERQKAFDDTFHASLKS